MCYHKNVPSSQSHGESCHVFNDQTLKHNCITTLKTLNPPISYLAVHDNLLYAASINEINVFDLFHDDNFTHVDTFSHDLDSGSVKSIAFNETKIFTAHQDCKIRVWQITPSKRHRLVSTLPTVKDRFRLFMLPKNYVNVRRHKKRLWVEHWDTVSDLVVKEGLMYSVSWDKSFKMWNSKNYSCLESIKAHNDAVNAVVVSENGVVYTGSADGSVRIWERVEKERKHKMVATLDKHKSAVNALALSSDGSSLFSGGGDRSIVVWERRKNGKNDHAVFSEALLGHTEAVLCLTTVDGLLVSGSADRTVRIWRRAGKECNISYSCMLVLEGHEKPVKSLAAITKVVSDGFVSIFSGSLDGEIRVWGVCMELTTDNLKNSTRNY